MDACHQLLIDGRWRNAASAERYEVFNPATEEALGTAAQAGPADVEEAIAAAQLAMRGWRRTDPWSRSRIIRRIGVLIMERHDEIARLITAEIGKPLDQARGEVQMAADLYDWFADETRRIYGQVIQSRSPHSHQHVVFEPVGIVAAFTAWNFPVLLMSRKIAPALAAGCAIICRPAEESPGAVLGIARCCLDAGVPPGVVNVLTGLPAQVTPAIMAAPEIRKITFTGSVPVGKLLIQQSAATVKRVTMELGGHAPVIVHADADARQAAEQSAMAKFRNGGQICASPTRFYVHESKVDAFAEAFADRARHLRLGNGMETGVEMGPMATRRRRDAVEELVADASSAGATILAGGKRPAALNRGWFYEPTVVMEPPSSAKLMYEEPFGPIASINRFSDPEQAIAEANSLEFGLAAYVFTSSLGLAHETASALEAGVVGVNTFTAANAETPFGGVKSSGFGREGGFLGMRDYLDAKYVNLALPH